MYFVSIMIPAFSCPKGCDIKALISQQLNIDAAKIDIFSIQSEIEQEYAAKIQHLDLNLDDICRLRRQNSELHQELQRLKQQIMALSKAAVKFTIEQPPHELHRQLKQTKQLLKFYVGQIERMKSQSNETIREVLSQLHKLRPIDQGDGYSGRE